MQKEFLYVGHYISGGYYVLKVGTTNDIERRIKEHTRSYKKTLNYPMSNDAFIINWCLPLSKYNTLRYEDRTKEEWKALNIGKYIRNDRFICKPKPKKVKIKIRKEYEIEL